MDNNYIIFPFSCFVYNFRKEGALYRFKKLYEAVIFVQENSDEYCSTCLTPLSQVTVNPFEHANTNVNKNGDGNLSLKLRSPKSPIELRNLTEQLKSKINKAEFSD